MNESDFAQTNQEKKYEQMDCLLMSKTPEKFIFIRRGSKTASRQRIWIQEEQKKSSRQQRGEGIDVLGFFENKFLL